MSRVVALAVSIGLALQAASPCGHACHAAPHAVTSTTVPALPAAAPPSQHACHKPSTDADRFEPQAAPCAHDQGAEAAILEARLAAPNAAKAASTPAGLEVMAPATHVADSIGYAHAFCRHVIPSPPTRLPLQLRI